MVARYMILQQIYKLCIGIDLENDNQYWIVLINNAIGECSTDPIHRTHLILLLESGLLCEQHKDKIVELLFDVALERVRSPSLNTLDEQCKCSQFQVI